MYRLLTKILLATGFMLLLSSCANKLTSAPHLQETFTTFQGAAALYNEHRNDEPYAIEQISNVVNQKDFNVHLYRIQSVAGQFHFESQVTSDKFLFGQPNSYTIVCSFDSKNEVYQKIANKKGSYPINTDYTIRGNFDYLSILNFGNGDFFHFYIKDCTVNPFN